MVNLVLGNGTLWGNILCGQTVLKLPFILRGMLGHQL